MIRLPPRSTRTDTLFPYTTLFRSLPSSLSGETSKVGDWNAADTGRQRPWLCGFSNGAAMAASLLLSNPGAYSGLIMIGGCFAVERSEEHTSELQSLMRISSAVFCLKKKKHTKTRKKNDKHKS